MDYAKINSNYYCGIDLHSKSMYVCLMDREGNILIHKNMRNDFDHFKKIMKPYLNEMAVGVESTYNYYWLADACREDNIPFHLGHAFYMKCIHGGKVSNDKIDLKKITDLMRSNHFPVAYPYPKKMRSTRDLLRRRHYSVLYKCNQYHKYNRILYVTGDSFETNDITEVRWHIVNIF